MECAGDFLAVGVCIVKDRVRKGWCGRCCRGRAQMRERVGRGVGEGKSTKLLSMM